MSENTFDLPTTARPQLDTFFRSQEKSGLLFQAPVVPTDVDLAVAILPGTLVFDGAILAIQTDVATGMDSIIVGCFSNGGMVETQRLSIGTGETITLRVIRKILGPKRVILVFGFSFFVKGGVLEIGGRLFFFGQSQTLFMINQGLFEIE